MQQYSKAGRRWFVPEALRCRKLGWLVGKKQHHLMISHLLTMGLWWQLPRSVDSRLGGMKCWVWRKVPGELKGQVTWGILVECRLDQQLLCISSSELLIRVPTCWWRCSFNCQQMERWDVFWEGSLDHGLLWSSGAYWPWHNDWWRC